MKGLLRSLLVSMTLLLLWLPAPPVAAIGLLVPCRESAAFVQRQQSAPNNYYTTKPFAAYSTELLCGEDGLPHLPLNRRDRAIDVVIPFTLFFYVAGFIGWAGRSYLQAANRSKTPEDLEIFIDLPLALKSLLQSFIWPLLVFKELVKGEFTAKETEISVSPR